MPKFVCPKCRADNQVEQAGQGCACCGYGRPEPPPRPKMNEEMCHECNQPMSKCKGQHCLCG